MKTSKIIAVDFLAELQAKIRNARQVDLGIVKESPKILNERLYNIHKRSLPIGIDKVVVVGVTKLDGEWWIERKLKPKVYQDDIHDSKTIIYYDLVPVDATPRERSIYYNNEKVTR